MCNAGAAAAAALALQAVGGLMQAEGARREGESMARDLENEADLYDHNARIQDEQARILLIEAGFDEEKAAEAIMAGEKIVTAHRQQVKQFLGTQKTQIASSGIEVNTGTAMMIQADTELGGEVDAITIEYNTEKQSYEHHLDAWRNEVGAWEAKEAAKGSRMSAKHAREAAGRARRGGAYGAGAALIGGAARGLKSYSDYSYRSGK